MYNYIAWPYLPAQQTSFVWKFCFPNLGPVIMLKPTVSIKFAYFYALFMRRERQIPTLVKQNIKAKKFFWLSLKVNGFILVFIVYLTSQLHRNYNYNYNYTALPPTTFRSISGFALRSILHSNQPPILCYLWHFRHPLVRYYRVRSYTILYAVVFFTNICSLQFMAMLVGDEVSVWLMRANFK